jgi:molybdopterin adenylyltransferase
VPRRADPGGGRQAAVLHQGQRPEGTLTLRVAILTVSDAGSRGEREDTSGVAIAAWAAERGFAVVERALVPDETGRIAAVLAQWADGDLADLVLTTGGTGLTARDVTPEATRAVLDKEAPGIAEALRATAYPRFPRAALSRGTAGVRGRTLVVNLPGSPGGVRDGLAVLDGLVRHAVELVRGENTTHEGKGVNGER